MYCGKENTIKNNQIDPIPAPMARPQARLAHNVVMRMMDGLANVGHVVIMDNFFSSIELFKELLSQHIYASGTVHFNWIRLPTNLKNTKSFKNL